ncbi:hypothetical protein EUGRSUZ_D00740 [Eucalyptus grandis]|uniref:Uncharacterized protein n=1 Tax=Eucalyptus grandis TaxID=71139 RepID=A0A059CEL4_EUCGR|nr:hypothetical protein EUGRSUZ_D00740 [Eucalyptus grandis]
MTCSIPRAPPPPLLPHLPLPVATASSCQPRSRSPPLLHQPPSRDASSPSRSPRLPPPCPCSNPRRHCSLPHQSQPPAAPARPSPHRLPLFHASLQTLRLRFPLPAAGPSYCPLAEALTTALFRPRLPIITAALPLAPSR